MATHIGDVKKHLTEVGGQTALDLGLGRIAGQLLTHLFLCPVEQSLDAIAADLSLSKAAVSIAARQLESLGLLRRSWKQGDRKTYYRTADDIASALHQGLLMLIRNKMGLLATELKDAETQLGQNGNSAESAFVLGRVRRARKLRDTAMAVLENPMVRLLTGAK